MKYLSSFFLIIFLALTCLAQKKESPQTRENKELKPTPQLLVSPYITIKPYSFSFKADEQPKEILIDFDNLPDRIVIRFSGETKRDNQIIFTRLELYRAIQYLSFLQAPIGAAWETDQPKDAK